MICLKTFISKQGRVFDKQAKQIRQMKKKLRSKYKNIFFLLIYFPETYFPTNRLSGNVENIFDNCADKSLPKYLFFKLSKKTPPDF